MSLPARIHYRKKLICLHGNMRHWCELEIFKYIGNNSTPFNTTLYSTPNNNMLVIVSISTSNYFQIAFAARYSVNYQSRACWAYNRPCSIYTPLDERICMVITSSISPILRIGVNFHQNWLIKRLTIIKRNTIIAKQENKLENVVCKIAVILSRPLCVKAQKTKYLNNAIVIPFANMFV